MRCLEEGRGEGSRGCIVSGEGERPGDPSPRVAVLGCDNLVMPKDRAQNVKLVAGDGW
ncbi:MAG: hypothetical protein SF028_00300 [Candidatus Sumerlaeia bacterium]|nr:hypothetical protein [Candidatus Sumerlaeia bacterium]